MGPYKLSALIGENFYDILYSNLTKEMVYKKSYCSKVLIEDEGLMGWHANLIAKFRPRLCALVNECYNLVSDCIVGADNYSFLRTKKATWGC